MTVNGLAKLTLLDFPGRTAATVFLAGCNMRCPFCHNAPLIVDMAGVERIEESELRAFLAKRRGVLDGVAITGGEPTLRKDLGELLSVIKEYGYDTKLDTNGTNPDILRELIHDKLVDYVAMDIKNAPARYAETVGVENFDMTPIFESVKILRESGVEHEFRTTVVSGLHDEASMRGIGEWLCGTERYFLQNFVDSGALLVPGTAGVDRDTMRAYLEIIREYIPSARLRGM
ncbi:MAG: anaerobic ribonucleoside-triphosphate reductase activating protein [Clostridia bacterium]|nr:anaerobic ribonucleoside-triphosphate reductase activating protein [Clostridia bacterium]